MKIVIDKTGNGDYSNIQEAVDSIPENNDKRVLIYIKSGIYKEKINITKNYIYLKGESCNNTILTFNDSANTLFQNGERMRTFNSYTVFIGGDDFQAENITFENSAGDGDKVGQAVAAYVDGDRATFKKCKFIGHQDTLLTGPLPPKPIEGNNFGGPRDGKERRDTRQYYEECYIRGDIDFIFGSAAAVFNKCEIFSNDRNKEVNGYVTAASTPEGNEFGYVFIDCKFTSNAKPHTVYLGRPWRDYAKTAFINCFMGEHIIEAGFHNWNKVKAEKLTDYVEYGSYGPGATMDKRVSWARILNHDEAKKYCEVTMLRHIKKVL